MFADMQIPNGMDFDSALSQFCLNYSNGMDRDEAISQLCDEPTAYAFEQLSFAGEKEDIQLLKSELLKLSSLKSKDHNEYYLIATCAKALGKLASRYNCLKEIVFIRDIYNDYKNESYKYLFNDVLKALDNHGL